MPEFVLERLEGLLDVPVEFVRGKALGPDRARRRCAPGGWGAGRAGKLASFRRFVPIRVNLIAAGFVDPLSAALLGDQLDARRDELRATLPIGRVVGPADVAALAIHLMTNTALTGATYDIDGGQQLISSAT